SHPAAMNGEEVRLATLHTVQKFPDGFISGGAENGSRRHKPLLEGGAPIPVAADYIGVEQHEFGLEFPLAGKERFNRPDPALDGIDGATEHVGADADRRDARWCRSIRGRGRHPHTDEGGFDPSALLPVTAGEMAAGPPVRTHETSDRHGPHQMVLCVENQDVGRLNRPAHGKLERLLYGPSAIATPAAFSTPRPAVPV